MKDEGKFVYWNVLYIYLYILILRIFSSLTGVVFSSKQEMEGMVALIF